MHVRDQRTVRFLTGSLLVLLMTVFSSPYIPAQNHVTTESTHTSVRSGSFTGTIVVGAALVGRIDAGTVHGWWSLRAPLTVVSSVDEAATPGRQAIDGVVTVDARDDAQVTVRDVTGKLLDVPITNSGATTTIDLSGVISGVYFVQVVEGDHVQRHRILTTR